MIALILGSFLAWFMTSINSVRPTELLASIPVAPIPKPAEKLLISLSYIGLSSLITKTESSLTGGWVLLVELIIAPIILKLMTKKMIPAKITPKKEANINLINCFIRLFLLF